VLDALGWHICLNFRSEAPARLSLTDAIGIDRGIANTLAFSDGTFASQPVAAMRALQRRARGHQKQMARQKSGSARRAVTRRLLAKTLAKIARTRKHWNHEQTTRVAQTYGTVVIEALKTASMTRSAKGTVEDPGVNVRQKAGLNRSILEQGWNQFEMLLTYKLAAAGGALIKVNPVNTSRGCFACGSISKDHRKSQAAFECTDCGHTAHADTNAAMNILRAGEQPAWRGAARPSVKRKPDTHIDGFYKAEGRTP
jgi:putative transposase